MADAVLKDLLFRSHVALQIAMTRMDTVHAAGQARQTSLTTSVSVPVSIS